MDSCIKEGGDQKSEKFSPRGHEMALQKSPPEDLLPRAGDEEQEKEDQGLAGPFSEGIDPSHLGLCPGKNLDGNCVAQEKNRV